MDQLLCFKKIKEHQNILYDEFFLEVTEIEFIAFNYDKEGSALCRCDGKLQKLDREAVDKVLFGVEKSRLDTFIQALYKTDIVCADVVREGGKVRFRLQELSEQDKYAIGNFAKQTHKELRNLDLDRFYYFEQKQPKKQTTSRVKTSGAVFGNEKSKVFHRPDCRNFNSKTCTAKFGSQAKAVSAGFRPCKSCMQG